MKHNLRIVHLNVDDESTIYGLYRKSRSGNTLQSVEGISLAGVKMEKDPLRSFQVYQAACRVISRLLEMVEGVPWCLTVQDV